jgi:membrane fusion protein (multidrug efflux system)
LHRRPYIVRYVVAIIACFLVLGLLGGVKAAQIATLVAHGKQAKEQGPPPETVATVVAKEDVWQDTLTDVGTVTSAKGVTLRNDVAGLVKAIHFESGQEVTKGVLLVELDSDVERAQLAAARAREALNGTTLARSASLRSTDAIPQAQLDADLTQWRSSRRDADAIRAQVEHKEVRAPFDGRLGIRGINLGQYLASGSAITQLETVKVLYIDFTIPQQRLGDVAIGMPVRVTTAGVGGSSAGSAGVVGAQPQDAGAPREGAIEAIDPAVDLATRTVRIRATVPNQDEALRSGMFARATVLLPNTRTVVIIPSTALLHASFGDSVFIVEEKAPGAPGMHETPDGRPVKVVRQQFVRTGEVRGDFVAILEGVKAGEEVVVAGAFKLHNGSPVTVNEAVQPTPELSPHPQNR